MTWHGIPEKCDWCGWQHFLFIILFQTLVLFYYNHLPPVYSWPKKKERKGKKGIIVARGMQQEHIQWQLKQDLTLHMQQQADDWQSFSKKKAAKARTQRLSPVGRMTWWGKGRKWCHNSAQWQMAHKRKKHNGIWEDKNTIL